MKIFIIKIVILFLGLAIIDFSLSKILDYGQTSDYRAFIESKKQFDELEKVDIIFIGDSQTADCFVPSVFNQELNVQSFNYGVYLMSPVEQYYLLRDLISRHNQKPGMVILGTNVNCFNYPVSYGRFTPMFIKSPLNLFPLLMKSKKFEALTSAGRKGYLFSSLVKKIQGKDEIVHRKIDGIEFGYLRVKNHYRSRSLLTDCNRDANFFKEELVNEQLEYYIKTLELLKENNIDFLLVNPPIHKEFLSCLRLSKKYEYFKNTLTELSTKYNFRIFNSEHNLLLDQLVDIDFYNGDHLCYSGAVKFSKALSKYLLTQEFSNFRIANK